MKGTMDKERAASELLSRFGSQLRWTVRTVVTNLELPPDYYPEVRQRAEIQLAAYAGLMDGHSWGQGRLAGWEKAAEGNECEVKKLVGRQLRIDLHQIFIRVLKSNGNEEDLTVSADGLIDTPQEPTDEHWEDRQMSRIAGGTGSFSEANLMRRYPHLARNVLDGLTQKEIAERDDISVATVERRIAAQKKQFLKDCVSKSGLVVEGDESQEELMEAYDHLKTAMSSR